MKQELISHNFVKGLKLADTNPLMQKINITQRIACDLKLSPIREIIMKVNGFYSNREAQMKLQGYELKKKLWAILKAYYLPKLSQLYKGKEHETRTNKS